MTVLALFENRWPPKGSEENGPGCPLSEEHSRILVGPAWPRDTCGKCTLASLNILLLYSHSLRRNCAAASFAMGDDDSEEREIPWVPALRRRQQRERLAGFDCDRCQRSMGAILDRGGEAFYCPECRLGPHCDVWCDDNPYWKNTTLRDVGFVFQLGHGGFQLPFPPRRSAGNHGNGYHRHPDGCLSVLWLWKVCARRRRKSSSVGGEQVVSSDGKRDWGPKMLYHVLKWAAQCCGGTLVLDR
ncbi:hypothetical protein DFH06DRAFT_1149862 [Mycena polygramma]|nr:hypothetical protein DFH06DRAFT_1149862 [Mycena polygramma]